jgi:type I restriction enzyme S subunit
MSPARYHRYKDSGVEWLGDVPEHWAVFPLKRDLAFLTSGSRGWAGNYSDEGNLFIRIGNLTRDSIAMDLSDVQRVVVPPGVEGARTIVRPGDVLFSITAYLGSVAVVPDDIEAAYVSQHVALARLHKKRLSPSWVAYVTVSYIGKTYLEAQGYGGTKIQLSLDDVANLVMTAPPLDEQDAITHFLDRETGKIDALVEQQRRLIELLKEKRQAVISHFVTKGLNPNAPMKDSGVEWLGEVPAHWDLKRFGYISAVVRGASPRPAGDERYFDGDFMPWVTVGDLTKDQQMYLTSTDSMLTQAGAEQSRVIPDETLVLSNSGATLGVPKILSLTGCANDGVLAFLNLECNASKQFLYYYLTSLTENLRDRVKQGSGQPNLNTDIVKALPIPWPGNDEQIEIASHVGEKNSKLDALTAEASHVIDLLQERRAALISAAVTGKIDVRGLVEVSVA